MRHLGIDLHSNNLVVCYLSEQGEQSFAKFQLSEIERFQEELMGTDVVAVEATANSRWFVKQISSKVGRIEVVNPRRFKVIAKSVKKTDRADAALLAEFSSKQMLPTVRQKTDAQAEAQSLCSLRTNLVEMRTALFNRMQAIVIGSGGGGGGRRQEAKRSVKSVLGRKRLLAQTWTELERIQLEIIARQINELDKSIEETEAAIAKAGESLPGYENLLSIKGIGSQSAALLTAVIGNIADFETENKLASYFGVVPSVSNSNQSVRHGRITKQANKAARTALLQCALAAKKFSEYLKQFYERIKERRGAGKAKIALARKFLTVIYHTLKNDWKFTDFTKFEKAEA
jgi:transposase